MLGTLKTLGSGMSIKGSGVKGLDPVSLFWKVREPLGGDHYWGVLRALGNAREGQGKQLGLLPLPLESVMGSSAQLFPSIDFHCVPFHLLIAFQHG